MFFKIIFAWGIEKKDVIEKRITPKGNKIFFKFIFNKFSTFTSLKKVIDIKKRRAIEVNIPNFSKSFKNRFILAAFSGAQHFFATWNAFVSQFSASGFWCADWWKHAFTGYFRVVF